MPTTGGHRTGVQVRAPKHRSSRAAERVRPSHLVHRALRLAKVMEESSKAEQWEVWIREAQMAQGYKRLLQALEPDPSVSASEAATDGEVLPVLRVPLPRKTTPSGMIQKKKVSKQARREEEKLLDAAVAQAQATAEDFKDELRRARIEAAVATTRKEQRRKELAARWAEGSGDGLG